MNALTILKIGAPSSAYRCAVQTILRDLMHQTGDTLRDIAENIDVSENTLYNALHERSDLSAAFLFKLGAYYGPAFLNPCFALMGAQVAPLEAATRDVLPLLTMAAHTLACARDPAGPGGTSEVPQEKALILKTFKPLQRELGGQIAHIEEVLA